MNKTLTALAVLTIAAAGPAMAQTRGEPRGEPRGDAAGWRGERSQPRDGARQAPSQTPPRPWSRNLEAREAPRAPEARQAPVAPEAGVQAPQTRPDGVARGEGRPSGGAEGAVSRPGRWVDDDGDAGVTGPQDNWDREDRREALESRRFDGPRAPVQVPGQSSIQPQRQDPRGERPSTRDGGGRQWQGRWSNTDRQRWDRMDRDRDRQRGDRPYWSQGRYPFAYQSARRYRAPAWRAPVGFYLRTWSYGDYLPFGWYDGSYRLGDWAADGLPWPPPGYDWVRVGPDVLLVDRFTGRVVQVVRALFW